MRFLVRALTGSGLIVIVAAALVIALRPYWSCAPGLDRFAVDACVFARDAAVRATPPSERVVAVRVGVLRAQTVHPTIAAFGDVAAARRLTLRAPRGGVVVEVGSGFRNGGRVAAGELLFQLDPGPFDGARDEAAVALIEATAERDDARRAEALAAAALRVTETELTLRRATRERLKALLERGLSAATEIDAAEIAVVSAERASIDRQEDLSAAERRRIQADQAALRAERALADAEFNRSLARQTAPFAGVVDGVEASAGASVGENDVMATLVDPTRLEASFRLPRQAFARLIDEGGRLAPLEVRATLELGPRAIAVSGRLDRVAGAVDRIDGGRRLYATLETEPDTVLRPGDFIKIEILEPPIEGVAEVPSGALDQEDRLLAVGDDGRLAWAPVRVLRRDRDWAVIDAPREGLRYVIAQGPRLGPGVKVDVRAPTAPGVETAPSAPGAETAPSAPGAETAPSAPGAETAPSAAPGSSVRADGDAAAPSTSRRLN